MEPGVSVLIPLKTTTDEEVKQYLREHAGDDTLDYGDNEYLMIGHPKFVYVTKKLTTDMSKWDRLPTDNKKADAFILKKGRERNQGELT